MTTDGRIPILDANILLAMSVPAHVHHDVAHRYFSALKEWATTPLTESALLRLLLAEAVIGRRVDPVAAREQVRAIRSVPGWQFVADDSSLLEPLIDTRVLMGRQQVTDLHLVNLAAGHGMVLATFDAKLQRSLADGDREHLSLWRS